MVSPDRRPSASIGNYSRLIASAVWLALVLLGPAGLADTRTPGMDPAPDPAAQWTFWIAVTGACTGVLGAGLGIYNAWNAFSAKRIRISVRPSFVTRLDGSPVAFSIEVVNRSTFAVTVEEVGFTYKKDPGRAGVISPILPDGKGWPRRLEARETVSVHCFPHQYLAPAPIISQAYARLATGELFRGTSPAIDRLRAQIAALHAE